jgi:hypothetical protein
MNKLTTALLALSLLAAGSAGAQSTWPEDGWWWDPNASGRGYLIERQADTMFIASFHYTPEGAPEWLVAAGAYSAVEAEQTIGEFSGEVYYHENGQCIGCAYTEPLASPSSQGLLEITFTDNRNGVLEWSGESIAISRMAWGWYDVVGQLSGNWLITLLEDGTHSSQLVSITDSGSGEAEIRNLVSDTLVGTIEMLGDEPVIMLPGASEPALPLVLPESQRFYAGYGSSQALQMVGLRLDDLPLVVVSENPDEVVSALDQFTASVSITVNGNTLVINSDGLPNHASPYWGAGHELYEAPHSGMVVNPNRIETQDITLRIPANPTIANSPSDTDLGPIGVAVNGVMFYNQYAGINRTTGEWLPLDNEIATFDAYNGHPQNFGQYHYHLDPTWLTVADNAAYLGFARDGFPIYGPRNPDGSGLDLDECNGETHATPEYPDGIYHYHITQVVPYILGCYRGTPGTVTQ